MAPASLRPAAEQIRLAAERRLFLKRRWRGFAEDGVEFGFDLQSRLSHGAVIHQTNLADYVVCQEPEPVFEVEFREAGAAALVGWKLGNLHLPVEIAGSVIRVLPDDAAKQLFEREGWTYREAVVIFNPLRVAAHVA